MSHFLLIASWKMINIGHVTRSRNVNVLTLFFSAISDNTYINSTFQIIIHLCNAYYSSRLDGDTVWSSKSEGMLNNECWQRVLLSQSTQNEEMALEKTMSWLFPVKIEMHYFKHLNAKVNPGISA